MLPYPLTRLPLVGVLAISTLALSACAPVAPRPAIEQAGLAQDTGEPADPSADMMSMQYVAPPMGNVRELRDSELTCAEIYAETQSLEKIGSEQQAKASKAQQSMAESQEKITKQASSMGGGGLGGSIGSSLLGMVPGGSLVAGMAMQAAASARTSAIQNGANEMMQTQTEIMNTEMALQQTRARGDHLATLFLDKGCKLSEVQGTGDASP